ITGLAVVVWAATPPAVTLALWLYTLCVFVAVETVELVRLGTRIRRHGWRRGAFDYHVTQWSRNFTFGMFYAFTLALSQRYGPEATAPWVETVQRPILDYGPYAVLFLLIVEILLFLKDRLGPR